MLYVSNWTTFICKQNILIFGKAIDLFFHPQNSAQLLKMNRFVRKLSPVTQTPHIRVDCDAIGSLMAICEKRRWPFAK